MIYSEGKQVYDWIELPQVNNGTGTVSPFWSTICTHLISSALAVIGVLLSSVGFIIGISWIVFPHEYNVKIPNSKSVFMFPLYHKSIINTRGI